ncbi:hypothetical protein [Bacteroides sedimenti]
MKINNPLSIRVYPARTPGCTVPFHPGVRGVYTRVYSRKDGERL